ADRAHRAGVDVRRARAVRGERGQLVHAAYDAVEGSDAARRRGQALELVGRGVDRAVEADGAVVRGGQRGRLAQRRGVVVLRAGRVHRGRVDESGSGAVRRQGGQLVHAAHRAVERGDAPRRRGQALELIGRGVERAVEIDRAVVRGGQSRRLTQRRRVVVLRAGRFDRGRVDVRGARAVRGQEGQLLAAAHD